MTRFLPIAAAVLLAGSAARAQTYFSLAPESTLGHDSLPISSAHLNPPAIHAAPEFHAAGAIAALTLLLCGVAVLKGSRRE
jgi:hypothetical protein